MAYKNKQGAKEKIYGLYDSIRKGSNFESLARKYSEDKNTSFKGGRLKAFSSGQLNSVEFEDMAFSLNNPNEVLQVAFSEISYQITHVPDFDFFNFIILFISSGIFFFIGSGTSFNCPVSIKPLSR